MNPALFITRADMKAWIAIRRAEVHQATGIMTLGVIHEAIASTDIANA